MTDTTARRPPKAIPVTILTGFLGAGKTTFLNELLKHDALSHTLVLINEFGEIGLDHLFVEAIDRDMMLMASGCLCCTIRGELADTLEDILRRLDNGRIKSFDRILIETTGLADPAPVMHTIMQHPYLMLRFFPESLVTIVDAINAEATLDTHAEAVKQIAMADRIVISKSDMKGESTHEHATTALRARIRALNPAALLFDKVDGMPDPAILLSGSLYDPAILSPEVNHWLRAEAAQDDHHHHGHRHDPNRHDAHIQAVCLRASEPLAPANFEMFIKMVQQVHGKHLLRLKGLVALADDPDRPLVVHGVQHVFHPPVRLAAWPDADHSTRVVCILHDMAASHVEGLWRAFVGVIAPDQPDAAALTSNPLKPAPGGLL